MCDQFAFRPTGSVTAALSCLFYNVTEALEASDHVRCFLIDFSKAFDTVTHFEFFTRLKEYGCHQVIINWLVDYLTGRTQSIATLDGQTPPVSTTRGLVQGSGIGPCAFLAYIAGLGPKFGTTSYFKFADDLTVLVRIDSLAEKEISNVIDWAKKSKLQINLSKTKEIVLRRPRVKHFVKPDMVHGIEQVDEVKLLGVSFNCYLNFNCHVDNLLQTISQRFYLLQTLSSQGMTATALEVVFKALVASKILFASPAYSGYLHEYNIDKLQSLCDKAYRRGYITEKMQIKQLFQNCDRRLFNKILGNPRHCLRGLMPPETNSHMQLRKRGHPYKLPLVKTDKHKSSFLVRCLYDFV